MTASLISWWKDLHKVVPGGFNRFQGLPPHWHPRAQDRSVWKQVLELNWIWIFTKYYSKFEFDTSFLTIDIVRLWCSVSLASRRVLLSWKLERFWVSIQQLMSRHKTFKFRFNNTWESKESFLEGNIEGSNCSFLLSITLEVLGRFQFRYRKEKDCSLLTE